MGARARWSRLAGPTAMVAALVVMGGWWLRLPALTTLVSGWPSMKPVTAMGFFLTGLSLYALRAADTGGSWAGWRGAGLAASVLAALFGIITILEYRTGARLGVDDLLMRHALAPGEGGVAGRMSEATAWAFAMLGASLFMLHRRTAVGAAHVLLILVSLIGGLAALGYAYGDLSIRALAPFSSVAAHTAVLFVLLALAALWEGPEGRMMRLVAGPGLGSRMLRRMLPLMLLVLFAAGLLRTWGLRTGFYRPGSGEPAVVLAVMVLLAAALLQNARTLSRVEAERDRFFTLGRDLFCILDVGGSFTRVNFTFTRLLGWDPDQLVNRPVMNLVHPDDRDASAAELQSLARGNQTQAFENRMQARDGSWRRISWTASPGPNRRFIYASGRDITDLYEAQEALRASEEDLAITLHAIGDGVIATDAGGHVTRINPAGERLTGWSAAEAVGRPVQDVFRLVDEGSRLPLATPVDDVLRTGATAGMPGHPLLIARDGTERPVGDSAAPIRDSGGRLVGVVMVFRDVSAEHAIERSLRDSARELENRVVARTAALASSERRFSDLFEFAPDGMVIADRDARITMVNLRAEQMLGWGRDELIGQPVEILVAAGAQAPHLLHRDAYLTHPVPKLIRSDPSRMRARRKDGSEFPVEVNLSPLLSAGETLVVAVLRDVTDQVELAAQFMQAQKMESVGKLAGAVAHDFNNLLTVINSVAEMAGESLAADDPLRKDLVTIRDTGWRAAALTRQLLAFSRRQILQPRIVNLNAVVEGLVPMLHRLLSETVKLTFDPAPDLENCRVDPGQVEQVVMNLVVNARDAMPRGGSVVIETRNVELDEHYAASHSGLVPGRFVMLAVTDTGTGMDAATMEHIFEPFFTTKGPGKGTGLGLSTVYGIVKQSGGDLWAYSEVGVGTSFKVYLPISNGALHRDSPSRAAPVSRGSETILVVEDDESLRLLTRRILERAGYTVVTVANASEAMAALDREDVRVQLILTDLVLPGMSGGDLARWVGEVRPDVRIVYTSGYTEDSVLSAGVGEGAHFVAKPFSAAQLTQVVREALDG